MTKQMILVVDDDDLVRNLAARTLERAGYACCQAADGAEAIDLFRSQTEKIRLVLLDLMMPNIDGAATMESIRAMQPDVPIILTSGFGPQYAFEHLTDNSLNAFIQKPYLPCELVDLVGRMLLAH